ncbi:MAG: elongation factor P [Proteobacteria bacterium]|nr:elongation factor P [Pseudomonadota bacterium]
MAQIDTSKMRPGTRVEIDGDPHVITQYDHMKPGKGGAIVRLKLKSLTSGAVIDRTLKSGASLPRAEVNETRMQYLYSDGERGVFMDQSSYEQVEIGLSGIDGADLLADGCEVEVLVHNGVPVSAQLPNFVELEVAETDPPEKGGKLKPARLETGAGLQVPSFVARGERVRVDTRTRKYVERA